MTTYFTEAVEFLHLSKYQSAHVLRHPLPIQQLLIESIFKYLGLRLGVEPLHGEATESAPVSLRITKYWMTARTFRLIKGDMLQAKAVSSFLNSTLNFRRCYAKNKSQTIFQETHRGWDWLLKFNAQLMTIQVKQETFTFLTKKETASH